VTLSTSGTPGAAHEAADLVVPEMIDNQTSTYQVAVGLGDDDATSLRAVRLAFENSMILSDGFGTGDTSSWSIAVP
jgi:histidine ammonia-lyase